MRKKTCNIITPFLCSFFILAAPCMYAYATEPTSAAQETVADEPGLPTFPQNAVESENTWPEDIAASVNSENLAETSSEDVKNDTNEENPPETEPEKPAEKTKGGEGNVVEPAAEPEDSIALIETKSAIDADGNVAMTVNTADDLILPVTMMMRGAEGTISMTVSRSGQQIKIKPDTYSITKAVDGTGRKLPSGAELTIPEEGGIVYLDFNKPDSDETTLTDFIKSNSVFLLIAFLLFLFYRKFIHT